MAVTVSLVTFFACYDLVEGSEPTLSDYTDFEFDYDSCDSVSLINF